MRVTGVLFAMMMTVLMPLSAHAKGPDWYVKAPDAQPLKMDNVVDPNYRYFSRVNGIKGYTRLMLDIADKQIVKAKDKNGMFLEPVSVMEKQVGIIPYDEAKLIVDRGVFSAIANACGYDWENESYLALMGKERASGKWSDRQLAYMGLLHGISMGYVEARMKKKKEACSVDMHTDVGQYLNYLQTIN